MRKKGFTLIELLVVIAIIAMLLAILMPALSKVKKIAMQVVCGTNLKGLGTAQMVYANDYEDEYAIAGNGQIHINNANWAQLTFGWNDPTQSDFSNGTSVGASLYLLVREADVSPKSFVCPAGGEQEYDGRNIGTAPDLDITEYWDFGDHQSFPTDGGPINCVSYAYQLPYSKHPADGTKSAAFAAMADRNPWYDKKLAQATPADMTQTRFMDFVWIIEQDWDGAGQQPKHLIQLGNSQPHDRNGQNVLFADGHSDFEKRSDVGVTHDNIYTPALGAGANVARQGGVPNSDAGNPVFTTFPAGGGPQISSDSFLVNDSRPSDP